MLTGRAFPSVIPASLLSSLPLSLFSQGMTPQRREFTYPRHLSKTRPHPELLEEFRASVKAREEGGDARLCDIPESSEEESTSLVSIYGTTIKLLSEHP